MSERDERLKDDLERAGIGREVSQAALDIDAVLQRWRRRVMKRELGHAALNDLGLDLDVPQLDVLMAVRAPANEFRDEDTGCETMVGTVAARLGIDPSRASRITSELIRRGFIRREVSQQDARRSVLELTETGARIVEAVRTYKLLVLGSYLRDWRKDEIETFLPLLERFSAWSERAERPSGPVASEVAQLRDALAEQAAPED
ncbi:MULTISPECIES: MarR family winged helix-turn-helix transcriptional regulator [Salipiger]|uniref:MarR family protein n=1 Tax=Salipiger profundus TaxID=1229727 RepID=A0A1U7D9A4_9RHOB|nr:MULTISPECIES: MarR family winged helix-turn-helix transcriptional regulator [Salipiger]APX24757.1 MarR family protein [Salipiger profundus]SFD00114.1 MarR family protein [Salipiger profundus]